MGCFDSSHVCFGPDLSSESLLRHERGIDSMSLRDAVCHRALFAAKQTS